MSYQLARPRSGTTTAAAILHFVVCGLSALAGLFLTLAGISGSNSSSDFGRGISTIALWFGLVVLVIAALLVWTGMMFRAGSSTARWILVVVYSLGLLSSLRSIGRGGTSTLGLAIDIGMLVLLFLPSTTEDFNPRQAWMPTNTTSYLAPVAPGVPPYRVQAYTPNATPPTPAIPAGWYPDPSGTGQLRYWNGAGWTEHTAPQPASGPR